MASEDRLRQVSDSKRKTVETVELVFTDVANSNLVQQPGGVQISYVAFKSLLKTASPLSVSISVPLKSSGWFSSSKSACPELEVYVFILALIEAGDKVKKLTLDGICINPQNIVKLLNEESLTHLTIRNCQFVESPLKLVAKSLEANQTLTEFSIEHCPFGMSEFTELLKACKNKEALRSLTLIAGGFGKPQLSYEVTARTLAEDLPGLHITSLKLSTAPPVTLSASYDREKQKISQSDDYEARHLSNVENELLKAVSQARNLQALDLGENYKKRLSPQFKTSVERTLRERGTGKKTHPKEDIWPSSTPLAPAPAQDISLPPMVEEALIGVYLLPGIKQYRAFIAELIQKNFKGHSDIVVSYLLGCVLSNTSPEETYGINIQQIVKEIGVALKDERIPTDESSLQSIGQSIFAACASEKLLARGDAVREIVGRAAYRTALLQAGEWEGVKGYGTVVVKYLQIAHQAGYKLNEGDKIGRYVLWRAPPKRYEDLESNRDYPGPKPRTFLASLTQAPAAPPMQASSASSASSAPAAQASSQPLPTASTLIAVSRTSHSPIQSSQASSLASGKPVESSADLRSEPAGDTSSSVELAS